MTATRCVVLPGCARHITGTTSPQYAITLAFTIHTLPAPTWKCVWQCGVIVLGGWVRHARARHCHSHLVAAAETMRGGNIEDMLYSHQLGFVQGKKSLLPPLRNNGLALLVQVAGIQRGLARHVEWGEHSPGGVAEQPRGARWRSVRGIMLAGSSRRASGQGERFPPNHISRSPRCPIRAAAPGSETQIRLYVCQCPTPLQRYFQNPQFRLTPTPPETSAVSTSQEAIGSFLCLRTPQFLAGVCYCPPEKNFPRRGCARIVSSRKKLLMI